MTVRKAGTANEIAAIRMCGRWSQQRDASTHATNATKAKREDFGVTAPQQEGLLWTGGNIAMHSIESWGGIGI